MGNHDLQTQAQIAVSRLTLAFSGAANGIPMLMRNLLRGLRCNALLDAVCPTQPLLVESSELFTLGLRLPSIIHSVQRSKNMISQEETLEVDLIPSLAQRRAFLKLPLEER